MYSLKEIVKRVFFLDEIDWQYYKKWCYSGFIIIFIIIIFLLPWMNGIYHITIK